MEELVLTFDKNSPQKRNSNINIDVENNTGKDLLYKLLLGYNGVWNVLKNYDKNLNVNWKPENDGKYLLMLQAKEIQSKKSVEYIKKAEYLVGGSEKKIIIDISINKEKLILGEKLNLEVETNIDEVMFKYWISGKNGWELIKDYSNDRKINFTANKIGNHQILVECKTLDSQNNFDDFKTKSFEVKDISKSEIVDFRCLSKDLLIGEELTFEVDSKHDSDRSILYKFLKIDANGNTICIQDYSSKRSVSFIEDKMGKYKILCLAKDIYSDKDYDDRALMIYNIKPYKDIKIKSFNTDFISPQCVGSKILLKSLVEGGNKLLYKFKIDGKYGDDSGYIKNNTYLWESKKEGFYNISLFVKDESFEGEYEDKFNIEYVIDKESQKNIRIKDVIISKSDNYLINEPINVKVIADGEPTLLYSFLLYKDKECISKEMYNYLNWVDFIPKKAGEYKLEIRVKDINSKKEYDCNQYINLNVKEYIEGKIDYILFPPKQYYVVGDKIELDAICQNTKDTLIRYDIYLNGYKIESIDYTTDKKFIISPKTQGKYVIDLFTKNIKCKKDFDTKKQVKIYINETLPVRNTKVSCNKTFFNVNEDINFSASSIGGREVCYEFYIRYNDEWKIVQKYSRKNYYTFMPFLIGKFKLLVLAKSYYKNMSYEDYDIFEFNVVNDEVIN